MRTGLTFIVLISPCVLQAQVAGTIVDPAIPAVNAMNPNGDGYVTSTSAPFTGPLDETEFELPFVPFAQYQNEPSSDDPDVAGCAFFDLVSAPSQGARSAYYYFKNPDGIADNADDLIVFRLRVAAYSTASNSFSVLIDTDYRFGFSGLEADPNAVAGNPGFEKEIVVHTNTGSTGGVKVFHVDGMGKEGVQTFSASIASNYQVSNALNGHPACVTKPVFLDFFLPFSALGISASTQIRMAYATNDNVGTALDGKASDIGGVDGIAIRNNDDQFLAAIGAFPPVAVINPANQAPLAVNASIAIDENAQSATLVHTVAATDANANALLFSITKGNIGSAFSINPATGEITVSNAAALDFETNPVFTLLVQVSDGNIYDNAVITVTLTDLNEAPMVQDAMIGLAENSPNGWMAHTVQATDQDANTVLQYSIMTGNTPEVFSMNSASGQITVYDLTLLDFESVESFTLTVRVTDGILSDDATITIEVQNVNEAPSLSGANFILDEHAPMGLIIHTVAASDPDAGTLLSYSITDGNTGTAFSIDNQSGAIRVNNPTTVDFETSPRFDLTVRVSDGELFSDAVTHIVLNDINEAPVIDDASVNVEKTLDNGDLLYTVVARDPDAHDMLVYAIESGNIDGVLTLDTDTGDIRIADVTPVRREPRSYDLVVTATDKAGLTGSGLIALHITRVPQRGDIIPEKGFSPDGDGTNEFWRIGGIEAIRDNTVEVFNRWGMRVFRADAYDNENRVWRGEAGTVRAESTYFFVIRAGNFKPITGYIIVKPR